MARSVWRGSLRPSVLALGLILAACASTGAAPGRGAAKDAMPDAAAASRNAVLAFGRICGRLDRSEVARRAARYGFLPMPPDRLPPALGEALARGDGALYARPNPGALQLVIWAEPASCELALGGVDPAAVDGEFLQFTQALASAPGLAVTRLDPARIPQPAGDATTQLRQALIIRPSALVEGQPATMVLRVASDGRLPIQVTMVHRLLPAPGAVTPAQGQEPKEPPATF